MPFSGGDVCPGLLQQVDTHGPVLDIYTEVHVGLAPTIPPGATKKAADLYELASGRIGHEFFIESTCGRGVDLQDDSAPVDLLDRITARRRTHGHLRPWFEPAWAPARGSGLQGLADRLDILGGRLAVQSPVG